MSARAHSLTIYDTIKPNSRLLEIPILLAFNLLLVASAYLSFELPFSPVPITGQTLGVLLVAMALGRVRGTAVVMAYLLEGAAGLPVFASGKAGLAVLFGPTGGYLLGFLGAAWLVGYLADCGWDRKIFWSAFAMTLGTAVIFICGLAQLSFFVPMGTLFAAGFWPFVPGAIVKIAIAAMILPTVWKFVGRKRQ
ncbi:biotin transporter BioY [candidate division GN15 bacterium]|nr:biotin transporter BioY [candidate division GN15 bacterium]